MLLPSFQGSRTKQESRNLVSAAGGTLHCKSIQNRLPCKSGPTPASVHASGWIHRGTFKRKLSNKATCTAMFGCLAILRNKTNCWKRMRSVIGGLPAAERTMLLGTWEIHEAGIFRILRKHMQWNASSHLLSDIRNVSHSSENNGFETKRAL